MKIVLANEGPRIEADAIGQRPLGGVETAVALLAQSFARRGHDLTLHFEGERNRLPDRADLVIATRVPRLFRYANLRNHRKLMVVDGSIGFCGGMNIRHGHRLRSSHGRSSHHLLEKLLDTP